MYVENDNINKTMLYIFLKGFSSLGIHLENHQNKMKNKLPKPSIKFQLNHDGQFNWLRKLQYKVHFCKWSMFYILLTILMNEYVLKFPNY
jgi:hypothetical protein